MPPTMLPLLLLGATVGASASTGVVSRSPSGCPCPQWCNASLLGRQPIPGATITVSATPGAANCTTIQGAIGLTRQGYRGRYVIEIAPGTYREKLFVQTNRAGDAGRHDGPG